MAENVSITIRAFDKTQKAFGGVTNSLLRVAKAGFKQVSIRGKPYWRKD